MALYLRSLGLMALADRLDASTRQADAAMRGLSPSAAPARLQQASSSGKPILLRLDAQAGHGIGSTAQQRHAMQADEWAFLLWQFGRAGLKP